MARVPVGKTVVAFFLLARQPNSAQGVLVASGGTITRSFPSTTLRSALPLPWAIQVPEHALTRLPAVHGPLAGRLKTTLPERCSVDVWLAIGHDKVHPRAIAYVAARADVPGSSVVKRPSIRIVEVAQALTMSVTSG